MPTDPATGSSAADKIHLCNNFIPAGRCTGGTEHLPNLPGLIERATRSSSPSSTPPQQGEDAESRGEELSLPIPRRGFLTANHRAARAGRSRGASFLPCSETPHPGSLADSGRPTVLCWISAGNRSASTTRCNYGENTWQHTVLTETKNTLHICRRLHSLLNHFTEVLWSRKPHSAEPSSVLLQQKPPEVARASSGPRTCTSGANTTKTKAIPALSFLSALPWDSKNTDSITKRPECFTAVAKSWKSFHLPFSRLFPFF